MANFWWAFDTGAYETKTGHLSILEDGAYFRLLRHYYKTGRPIPKDSGQIVRISGAHSAEEIAAVTFILESFFKLKSDGWHNKRADEELLKASKLSKLRANSAKRRWDDKRHAKAHANASASASPQASPIADTVTVTYTNTLEPKTKSICARFQIPSLGEVVAYCEERKNSVDPQQWFNYYTANGWKVGRNAMKDWRAAVRTWEKNGYGENRQPAKQSRAREIADNNLAAFAAAMGSTAVDFGAVKVQGTDRAGDRAVEGEVKRLPGRSG